MQSPQGANRPKPSSPLSLFTEGTEGDSEEEYQFDPIEPPVHQVNEEDEEPESDDGAILSTQEIDTTEFTDNASKSKSENVKAAQLSNPPKQQHNIAYSCIGQRRGPAPSGYAPVPDLLEGVHRPPPRRQE